jgi:hypothetical protein
VPRDRFPNFRDHGRMVDRPLLDVLASLQKRYGEAFASEAGLRRMICEDVGHMPGVDTVPTALERLERQGVLVQQWLKPGGVKPDGSPCTFGTRLIALPKCRQQRRGMLARANRREGVTGRIDARALRSLDQARRAIGKELAPVPAPAADALERRRESELARLRALEQAWADEPEPDKPPG